MSYSAGSNSAIVRSTDIRPRSDTGCYSETRSPISLEDWGFWRETLRAVAMGSLLFCFAGGSPVIARGGHGMGGFGMHGGRMGGGRGVITPVYVLITVSKITDMETFKAAVSGLTAPNAAFTGRLIVDADKPAAWEGTAAEHIVMIQFDNPDQAQAWKSSDPFKSFDANLRRSSESTIQVAQGQPTMAPHGNGGGRGRRGFDQKAFEANVKDYDQMLNNKLHSICKGC
jgi:uncharacterized protein (DUF1330 family)